MSDENDWLKLRGRLTASDRPVLHKFREYLAMPTERLPLLDRDTLDDFARLVASKSIEPWSGVKQDILESMAHAYQALLPRDGVSNTDFEVGMRVSKKTGNMKTTYVARSGSRASQLILMATMLTMPEMYLMEKEAGLSNDASNSCAGVAEGHEKTIISLLQKANENALGYFKAGARFKLMDIARRDGKEVRIDGVANAEGDLVDQDCLRYLATADWHSLSQQNESAVLESAIDALPSHMKNPMKFYYQRLAETGKPPSHEEVSDHTGQLLNTSKSHVRRAKVLMRDLLIEKGINPDDYGPASASR